MNREAFNASLHLADRLIRAGEHAEAITAMLPWAEVPTVGDFERTILAYNLAAVFAQTRQVDEAIAWCDWGLESERKLQRTLLAEHRATILHEAGRREEAIATWREVQGSGWLDEEGERRVEANLRVAGEARTSF